MIHLEMNFGPLRGGERIPRARVEALFERTRRLVKDRRQWEVSIAFVDARTMRHLNEAYYGGTGVTDVLAFPSEPTPWTGSYLGEILVYYPKARLQAQKRGVSIRSEVELLLVHGLLHLLGYDHDTRTKQAEMFGLQDQILERHTV